MKNKKRPGRVGKARVRGGSQKGRVTKKETQKRPSTGKKPGQRGEIKNKKEGEGR